MSHHGPVLTVRDLGLGYRLDRHRALEVVRGVSVDLEPGRILGLAGESGCGKSTLARAAIGWIPANGVHLAGTVTYEGQDLLALGRRELRRLWGSCLAYVPQEVSSALNPSRRVEAQLDEPLALHTDLSRGERRARVAEALERVAIDSSNASLSRYPFEFSGGQQQRIALAMAMLCRPAVLVLDEPTTGIDATLRVEVHRALRELLAGSDTAVVYISHDLIETAAISDELAIMYAGEIVESGPSTHVFARPRHPYAAALRSSVPTVTDERMVIGIDGRPPTGAPLIGCAFTTRCPYASEQCASAAPSLVPVGERHVARCHRLGEIDADASARRGALLGTRPAQRALLQLNDLSCSYRHAASGSSAVERISFELGEGETLGIVGESGSGKSTLLRAIAGLHAPDHGDVVFAGQPLAGSVRQRTQTQRQAIQLVFQNPERSLNPRHPVARILDLPLRLYFPHLTAPERRRRASAILELAQLDETMLDRYPHQLSGGEKQRVALARAFAAGPRLLLCDEVVSALDVSVQAVVMNLIRDYTAESGAAVIFVTHDLAVVRMMSDRVLVLRRGERCELAPTMTLFASPAHPYTEQLLASIPDSRPTAPSR